MCMVLACMQLVGLQKLPARTNWLLVWHCWRHFYTIKVQSELGVLHCCSTSGGYWVVSHGQNFKVKKKFEPTLPSSTMVTGNRKLLGCGQSFFFFFCFFHFSVYCTAKNFRQRKISSKATVRQFVRNLFSSNARYVGSLVLSSVVRFACLSFIFTFMTISDPTLFVLRKI